MLLSRSKFILILITLFAANRVTGQILDDTTEMVYGLGTTRFFTEEDIFLNKSRQNRIDTSLSDIHRYRYILYNDNYHQDLGNVGTALWPVFFRPEEEPGRDHGINIYREYQIDPGKIKYYNTKSPFTELKYVQGTQRYTDLFVDFARNINSNFSAGFNIRRFTTNKVLATASRELQTEHWSIAVQSAFISPDRRYKLLYNFTHLNNYVNEQGGIKPRPDDKIPEDLYLYERGEVWLNDVSTWERRNTHRIYHQFSLDTGTNANFKIFQVLERSLVKDRFEDRRLTENAPFYPNIYFDSTSTFFESDFDRVEQRTGVAGIWKGWQLTGHIRTRWLYANLYEEWEQEWFLGGTFTKDIMFKGVGLLNFDFRFDQMLNNDARKITLNLGFKGFGFKYHGLNRRPSILENRIYSNNFIWDKNLANMNSNSYEVFYSFPGKKVQLKPLIRLDEINNYIYFGKNATSEQAGEKVRIYTGGLGFNFHIGNWHFINNFGYTSLDGPDVIRFPEFFYNGQYYFSSGFRKGKIDFQIGFETTYRSRYYGNAYMPANFQFYLQDDFPLDEIIVPDFFVNLHFRSADAFISVPYFTQGWASPGYFTTPYYTAYTRPELVEFGFRWRFFD
jgi:Putative porin